MSKTVKDVLKDSFWIMPQTPEYTSEGIPYITSKNIRNGSVDFSKANYISNDDYLNISKNRPIKVDDILISMIGTLGETAAVKQSDGQFYGQNMFLIRLNNDIVTQRYFINFFNSPFVKRCLLEKQNQSTQRYLKANHIEELIIPVPSINEQDQITNKLDMLSRIITNRKYELQTLDDLIKARFVEMFGDPNTNGKKWHVGKILDVGKCVAGATPSTSKPEYWENGTIPWLSSGEVNKGRVYETDTKITQLGYDNASTKMIPPKTVILAMAGQGKTRGTAAITEIELCTNQSICSIVNNEKVNPEYLLAFLKMQYKELRNASTSAEGRGGLNLKIIGNYPIIIPPIELQNEFAEFVQQVDKSKVVVQKALDEAQLLFDSLMQKYFG